MDRITHDTAEFRHHWGLPQPEAPTLNREVVERYVKFFKEEFVDEMGEALAVENQERAITLICDCLTDGTVYMGHLAGEMGVLPLLPMIWKEIVRSNATKGSPDGLADETGRWIKGSNYERPVLEPLFAKDITVQLHCEFRETDEALVAATLPEWAEMGVHPAGGRKLLRIWGDRPVLPLIIRLLKAARMKVSYHGDYTVGFHFIAKAGVNAMQYQRWVKEVALYKSGLTYTASGLSAEAGEVMGVIHKTMRRLQTGAVFANDLLPKARAKFIDELSDSLFFLVANLNEIGLTVDDLIKYNMAKVEARMADGSVFSSM